MPSWSPPIGYSTNPVRVQKLAAFDYHQKVRIQYASGPVPRRSQSEHSQVSQEIHHADLVAANRLQYQSSTLQQRKCPSQKPAAFDSHQDTNPVRVKAGAKTKPIG